MTRRWRCSPISTRGSPKQWYVHPDHLDRPTKMTDASQTVVWDAYYWPYGEVRQPDPNRDVVAMQPDNLDGSTLTTNGGVSGGSQLARSKPRLPPGPPGIGSG